MTRITQIIKKPKKNGLQAPLQIHNQEGHRYCTHGNTGQFLNHLAKFEAAFSVPELLSNKRIVLNSIIVDLLSKLADRLYLLVAACPDPVPRAGYRVFYRNSRFSGLIDFICMCRFRSASKSPAISFDPVFQICFFIIAASARVNEASMSNLPWQFK